MSQPKKRAWLLCEDKAQDMFVRNFLDEAEVVKKSDVIKRVMCPGGSSGSAVQYVINKFPELMKSFNIVKNNQKNLFFFVVIDADEKSFIDRFSQLEESCKANNVSVRGSNDNVIYIVPKQNIETWIKLLSGDNDVDESKNFKWDIYKGVKDKEKHKMIKHAAAELARICRDKTEDEIKNIIEKLPSLMESCKEYNRTLNN